MGSFCARWVGCGRAGEGGTPGADVASPQRLQELCRRGTLSAAPCPIGSGEALLKLPLLAKPKAAGMILDRNAAKRKRRAPRHASSFHGRRPYESPAFCIPCSRTSRLVVFALIFGFAAPAILLFPVVLGKRTTGQMEAGATRPLEKSNQQTEKIFTEEGHRGRSK